MNKIKTLMFLKVDKAFKSANSCGFHFKMARNKEGIFYKKCVINSH